MPEPISRWSPWVLSVVVLTLTALAAPTSRRLLEWIGRSRRSDVVVRLAPSLSLLVYIVGLKIALELVPIHPRAEAWINDGIYLMSVAILLAAARSVALVAIEWATTRSPTSPVLQQSFIPLFRNFTTLFVFLVGTIMVLNHYHYDAMSLITTLGVSSLAVGFAAKDTLANMISGFTLIIDRNLRAGDVVTLAEFKGAVEEIGLRTSRIRLSDERILIVPNADLANSKFVVERPQGGLPIGK